MLVSHCFISGCVEDEERGGKSVEAGSRELRGVLTPGGLRTADPMWVLR